MTRQQRLAVSAVQEARARFRPAPNSAVFRGKYDSRSPQDGHADAVFEERPAWRREICPSSRRALNGDVVVDESLGQRSPWVAALYHPGAA